MYYITPSGARALVDFEYNGTDLSPIYRYVLSPFAGYLVCFLPVFIAPNVITTLGLMWIILSYLIIWCYCPMLNEAGVAPDSVPRWIFLFNSIAMLVYQTLDNMDGKQARRTGSSSPLGLLFDHGCDAFNLILGSGNWLCLMGIGPKDFWQCSIVVFCPMVAFFIATWEEYHTHKLVLPYFNGPTEGIITGAILSFLTFLWGASYWHGTSWCDALSTVLPFQCKICNLDLICMTALTAFVQETFMKIATVVRKTKSFSCLLSLIPILSLSVFSLVIFGTTHPHLFIENPRLCLHLVGLLFCEMVTQLMLDHMTSSNYQPFRYCLLPFLLFFVSNNDNSLLLSYTVAVAVFFFFKVRAVIWEICNVLGIWCFDIQTPFKQEEEFNYYKRN